MHSRVDRDEQALCRRHVARFERLLPEYLARIEWSWDQVRSERLRALRELLAVAVERSPWHRERLVGLDFSQLSEADVESLPGRSATNVGDSVGLPDRGQAAIAVRRGYAIRSQPRPIR